MVSRWERRSQEEKEKILAKVVDGSKTKEVRREEVSHKAAMEVYNNHEIPLRCGGCGWGGSDKYVLRLEAIIPGTPKFPMIVGTCRTCGEPTHKALMFTEEGLIDSMMMTALARDGRFVDERPRKPEGTK